MATFSKSPVTECSSCGGAFEDMEYWGQPESGWSIPWELLGGYGGFTDEFGPAYEGRPSKTWEMCHDCVVKMLKLFPRLANDISKGSHPCEDAVPCCEWAWKSEGGVIFIVVDGQWVFAPSEHPPPSP